MTQFIQNKKNVQRVEEVFNLTDYLSVLFYFDTSQPEKSI